jgi:hypothetical protein
MDAEEKALLQQMRPFDSHPMTGDGAMAGLRLDPGTRGREGMPEVWFYMISGDRFKMDLTYEGYLDALLDTRGFFDWQYLFSDVDIKRHYTDLGGRLSTMLKVLPRLFPSTDMEPYRERLQKLKARR